MYVRVGLICGTVCFGQEGFVGGASSTSGSTYTVNLAVGQSFSATNSVATLQSGIKSVSFTSQWSTTYNCQYFNSVTTADSFTNDDEKDIWEFNFRRGAAPSVNNGETYTGVMTVLGAAIEYWEK